MPSRRPLPGVVPREELLSHCGTHPAPPHQLGPGSIPPFPTCQPDGLLSAGERQLGVHGRPGLDGLLQIQLC